LVSAVAALDAARRYLWKKTATALSRWFRHDTIDAVTLIAKHLPGGIKRGRFTVACHTRRCAIRLLPLGKVIDGLRRDFNHGRQESRRWRRRIDELPACVAHAFDNVSRRALEQFD
jgi:hypothetical protein